MCVYIFRPIIEQEQIQSFKRTHVYINQVNYKQSN